MPDDDEPLAPPVPSGTPTEQRVEAADATLRVHAPRRKTCTWCGNPWPCPAADWAQRVIDRTWR